MTDFAECSMAMQDFLMILLEICLILELILLLIRITCFYGKKKIITAVTVFAVSFMLMGFLMNDHRYCQGESAYQLMLRMCPVSVLMAAMVVLLLYLCWAIWRERRRYHHSLSYWSVNEAVDDVPCGVCFSDPLGRIVLCNTKMHERSRIMTGSYLQDYEALRKVINGGSEAEGLRRLNSDSNVFYFPDDSVWMFQEYRLQEPDCAGYLRQWQLMYQKFITMVKRSEQIMAGTWERCSEKAGKNYCGGIYPEYPDRQRRKLYYDHCTEQTRK